MKTKSSILAVAAMLAIPITAIVPEVSAHFPAAPDENCNPTDMMHDWVVGRGTDANALAPTGFHSVGLHEGAINCPLEPICLDLDTDIDGDGVPDAPPVDTYCTSTAYIPGTDNESEYGMGGAFLDSTHHDNVVDVTADVLTAAWIGGSDGGRTGVSDGWINAFDDVNDCLSTIHYTPSTDVTLTDAHTSDPCPAGGDGGWWIFILVCGADSGHNGEIRFVDSNGDGTPDRYIIVPPTNVNPNTSCATAGHAS